VQRSYGRSIINSFSCGVGVGAMVGSDGAGAIAVHMPKVNASGDAASSAIQGRRDRS